MRNLIKSLIISGILVVSIFSILPDNLQAERTSYCEEAFNRCIGRCNQIFPTPFLNDACRYGCYLGLRDCLALY